MNLVTTLHVYLSHVPCETIKQDFIFTIVYRLYVGIIYI